MDKEITKEFKRYIKEFQNYDNEIRNTLLEKTNSVHNTTIDKDFQVALYYYGVFEYLAKVFNSNFLEVMPIYVDTLKNDLQIKESLIFLEEILNDSLDTNYRVYINMGISQITFAIEKGIIMPTFFKQEVESFLSKSSQKSNSTNANKTYRTKLTALPLIILIGGLSSGFAKLYPFMNNPQAILGFLLGSIIMIAVFYMMFTKTITPAKECIPKPHNTDDLQEALDKYFSIADSIVSTKTTDIINKVIYYYGVIEAFSEFNHVKTKDFLYKFFERHFKLSSKEINNYINESHSSKYRAIYEKGYDDFRNYIIDDEFKLQTKI